MRQFKYSVSITKGQEEEKVLSEIVADGLCEGMPHRYLVDSTGRRFEIPFEGTSFSFSSERSDLIAEQSRLRQEAEAKKAAAT